MKLTTLASCALAAALACGCAPKGTGEGSARPAAEPGAAPTPVAASAPAAAPGAPGTASVSGKVVFAGTPPPAEPVKLSSDAFCSGAHPKGMSREELVVGAGNGLANVFVYVKEGIAGTYPVPSTPVVLDQKGCAYHPHVFGVMAGQPIDILNSDETVHNVHAVPQKNPAFNFGMPVPGEKRTKSFAKPEVMVKIKCDVHGWMSSYAGVLTHPFFAVSGEDGSFRIEGLPAGTYTIEAWHEKLGTQTQTLTVKDAEAASAAFTFKSAA